MSDNFTLWFDEMNILQSEKVKRTKMAKQMANQISKLFAKHFSVNDVDYILLEIELTALFRAITQQYYGTLQAIGDTTERIAKYVVTTTENAFTEETIDNDKKTISKNYALSENRFINIALNETNHIGNLAMHEERVLQGFQFHIWNTMRDEKVRESHSFAEGQQKPINEPFIINGYEMMFPMDDSLGAPIDEIANCRCVATYK